jgi:aldose 1-epimerase
MFTAQIVEEELGRKIILQNTLNNTSIEVFSFGALLNAYVVHKGTDSLNCIDGFNNISEATHEITKAFKSAKLSPFVCRLNNGTYTFNKQQYTTQGFYLAPHAIHGLLYNKNFCVITQSTSEQDASVVLQYNYVKEDIGYPFSFSCEVIYTLHKNDSVAISTIITNTDSTAIPVADGWHPYFTLGNGIDNYTLTFDSNILIEFDDTLIPTGNKLKDERFINGAVLANIFLDNCFELNKGNKCIMENDGWRLTIEAIKNYPFLQVYTPPHRNSIAIENLSAAPDAFNNTMGLQILQPQQSFITTTQYTLVAKQTWQ